ncbi:hypothetical protein LCGC14_2427510, partial [marine sediment metagenome]
VSMGALTASSDIIYTAASGTIRANTSDASDNKRLLLLGGGANSSIRGAIIGLYGNEHASAPGEVHIVSGDISGSDIIFKPRGATKMTLDENGALIISNQVTIGGAIEAGSIFNIEPGVAARDILTSVGTGLHIEADSQAINAAGNGETVAIGSLVFLGIPTWTSVGTTFTISDAATLYIQGPPVDSTNVTHTREYALWSDDGANRFDGLLTGKGGTIGIDIDAAGMVSINDTTNANMTIGLTINQAANDDQIFACKSDDVAHGLVSSGLFAIETDTYFAIAKVDGDLGGTTFISVAKDTGTNVPSTRFLCYGGDGGTSLSTAGTALVEWHIAQHDDADTLQNITTGDNIFAIRAQTGGRCSRGGF